MDELRLIRPGDPADSFPSWVSILPNRSVDEAGHDGDAESAPGDDENLHQLPAPLEVLADHQSRAVPGHPHTQS